MTAGRSGCDFDLDLSWPAERMFCPIILIGLSTSRPIRGVEFSDLLAVEEVNVLGSLKLAHACSRAQVGNFLQISSIFAELTKESSFYSPYAISKRHAEELLDYYCTKRELALTVLRPSRIYGEGDSFRKHQPFLYDVLDKVQRGDLVVLHGENDSLRNFIHVDDFSEVISRVIGQGVVGFMIVLICRIFVLAKLFRLQLRPLVVSQKFRSTKVSLIFLTMLLNAMIHFMT